MTAPFCLFPPEAGVQLKTYIVQRADGEVVAVKLTWDAAHKIAKTYAPAKVLFGVADKTTEPNVSDHELDRRRS